MAWLSLGRGPARSWVSSTSLESPPKAEPREREPEVHPAAGKSRVAGLQNGLPLGAQNLSIECKQNKKHRHLSRFGFVGK